MIFSILDIIRRSIEDIAFKIDNSITLICSWFVALKLVTIDDMAARNSRATSCLVPVAIALVALVALVVLVASIVEEDGAGGGDTNDDGEEERELLSFIFVE